MPRVIFTAQVEDSAKWEKGYRTHGELLKSMTMPMAYFTTTKENEVAIYAEPNDLDKFFEVFQSPATVEAMAYDGVKRETVKVYVLDKEFRF
jgi:hypothetical protein